MRFKSFLGVLVVIAFLTAIAAYFHHEAGFTPWMTYREMDAFLKPLETKDASGKNFWDQGHWLTAVEGRWHAGQPQFRLRVGDAPKSGPRWWYWWFNQDQASFNKHIHDLSDDNFVLVYSNSFQWPDGTTRYSGVWHRVGKQPDSASPTPAKQTSKTHLPALLIGKWRDENSVVEYRQDGTKMAKYDNGFATSGFCTIDNDILLFTPFPDQGGKPTRHKLIELTDDKLTVQSLPDQQIYHAQRIRD